MHGLVSLLPSPQYQRVADIWLELETEFSLTGIKANPYPHFSWQIAEEYDFEQLKGIMSAIAESAEPFDVTTAGIAIFTGPRPIIYVPVVKSIHLMEFHARVWEETQIAGKSISQHYSPERWVPHISLAYADISKENISQVVEKLAFRPYTWEMPIDNLALIYEPTGMVGSLQYHFEFQNPK